MIRRMFTLLALGLVAVAVIVAVVVFEPLDRLSGDDEVAADVPRERAEISAAELTTTVEADGELAASWIRPVGAVGPGTITSLAPEGMAVGVGSVVFELDDRPTAVLVGDVPAWRTMTVDDVGVDVAQLEANLVELGHDPDDTLTVDETYTELTAAAVERWQTDLGAEVTGTVPLGAVVFVPEPALLSLVFGVVGDPVAGTDPVPLATVSSTDRQIVFPVPAADIDTIEVGTEISARLPDRSTITGRVSELIAVGGGQWSATAVPTPPLSADEDTSDDPPVLPDGESVPLTVSWTTDIADAATTVPARSLTRLDTGAYVVEVVDDDGTRFVEVEIGARSGSVVEIITELEPGTVVIAP